MDSPVTVGQFEARLEGIRKRIADACGRAGRSPGEVALLPVTKRVPPELVNVAAGCGLDAFGESRVQEALQKIPLCPGHVQWHMIGHLQSNKVRQAVELFSVVHSVDSLKLLKVMEDACGQSGRTMRVFLEINVSGEGSKYGLKQDEAPAVLAACEAFPRVEVAGLMTIPPVSGDPETARPHFRRLREIRDSLRGISGMSLSELSMGMSHDFEIAVEEGSTVVRIGSALFRD